MVVVPAAEAHARGSYVRELPSELYIETTNRCNLKCRTCPQYFGMSEDFADLTPELVGRILDQFPFARRVVLHGIGEPLLNKDLPGIVEMVKRRDAYALFNTNGLLLGNRLIEPVILAGLDELRVSIDSASPETYELVRGTDGFARIVRNLRELARLKDALASATPKVSLWITGMKSNVAELTALVRLAHDVGVREVYLQRLVYSERGLAVNSEALFGKAADHELRAVRDAETLALRLGVELKGSGEVSAAEMVTGGRSETESYRACRRPWSLMYVTANGNVLPCCIAPFTGAHYAGIVLGNIFQETSEEIWNGPRYQAWRRSMLAGDPPGACVGCGAGWSL